MGKKKDSQVLPENQGNGPGTAQAPDAIPGAQQLSQEGADFTPEKYAPPKGDADKGAGKPIAGAGIPATPAEVEAFGKKLLDSVLAKSHEVKSLRGHRVVFSFKSARDTLCARGGTNDSVRDALWRIYGAPAGMDGDGAEARPWRDSFPKDERQEFLWDRASKSPYLRREHIWDADMASSKYALFEPVKDVCAAFASDLDVALKELEKMRALSLKNSQKGDGLVDAWKAEEKRLRSVQRNVETTLKKLETTAFKKETLEAAFHGEGSLGDSGQTWDAEDKVLRTVPVKNGVVTITKDGASLRDGVPSDRFLLSAQADYDPRADGKAWRDFVLDIMGGNRALATYLQDVVGAALCRQTSEPALYIFWGTGSNGKSTFLNILAKALGPLVLHAKPALLLDVNRESANGPTPAVLELRGRALVVMEELKQGAKLDTASLKQLCAGSRTSARPLNGDIVHFTTTGTLVLCTNIDPVIGTADYGTQRRLIRIPFLETFISRRRAIQLGLTGNEPSPGDGKRWAEEGLEERLTAPTELEGVLAWAIEGAIRYVARGNRMPAEPESVSAATQEFIEDQNPIAPFINEFLISTVGTEDAGRYLIASATVFAIYNAWAERNGVRNRLDKDRLMKVLYSQTDRVSGVSLFKKTHTRKGNAVFAELNTSQAKILLENRPLTDEERKGFTVDGKPSLPENW